MKCRLALSVTSHEAQKCKWSAGTIVNTMSGKQVNTSEEEVNWKDVNKEKQFKKKRCKWKNAELSPWASKKLGG